jgi:hypothetical protein
VTCIRHSPLEFAQDKDLHARLVTAEMRAKLEAQIDRRAAEQIEVSRIRVDKTDQHREKWRIRSGADPDTITDTWLNAVKTRAGHWDLHSKDLPSAAVGYWIYDRNVADLTRSRAGQNTYASIIRPVGPVPRPAGATVESHTDQRELLALWRQEPYSSAPYEWRDIMAEMREDETSRGRKTARIITLRWRKDSQSKSEESKPTRHRQAAQVEGKVEH